MNQICRPFFFLVVLTISSCSEMAELRQEPFKIVLQKENQNAKIIYELLLKGKEYYNLSKQKKKKKCEQLKQSYKTQAYWHTAWLLVNALNDDFNCLSINKTLDLLNTIQNTQTESSALRWLNDNQIKILSKLNESNNKIIESNNKITESNQEIKFLRDELQQSEQLLRQHFSKIQELKAIETNINKKLEDEQTDRQ